ncbi:MAG: hypothetical protein AAAB36_19905, partial [Ensifer adhaerens]
MSGIDDGLSIFWQGLTRASGPFVALVRWIYGRIPAILLITSVKPQSPATHQSSFSGSSGFSLRRRPQVRRRARL